MARQAINIGAVANDGTGDGIRTGGDKINDNFEELYSILGWGYYQDAESSPATQSFNTTPSQLQVDGAGANSDSNYLPREIRGSSELWDTTNDLITPVNVGDAYDLRLDLEITGETGNPNEIIIVLDIGATPDGTGGAGSILIVERYISAGKGTPYNVSVGFPIFCLSTFVSNGGSIWISTDTGSITVAGRAIFIKRDMKGDI